MTTTAPARITADGASRTTRSRAQTRTGPGSRTSTRPGTAASWTVTRATTSRTRRRRRRRPRRVPGAAVRRLPGADDGPELRLDRAEREGRRDDAGRQYQPGIGLAWAWQSLTAAPFTIPAKDPNYQYSEIIILMSDGLNTQNRWTPTRPRSMPGKRQCAPTSRPPASRSIRSMSTPTAIRPRRC